MTTKQVQALLTYLGYDTGGVDGILGLKTKAAAYDFQQEFGMGLTVDGIPGTATQKALIQAVADGWTRPAKPSTLDKPQAGQGGDFWPTLKYFRRSDRGIACPCGRCGGFPVEPSETLMWTVDGIRDHFTVLKHRETPLNPSSTIRCQAHNDELPGSAKNSRHIQGRAMDFAISGVPVSEVLAYTSQLQREGKIHYTYEMVGTGHVHIDV